MKNKISSVSNEYFTAFVSVEYIVENRWHSVGQLMRNDTSEMLPRRYIASGDNEQHAIGEITRTLNTVIHEKGVPYDWKEPDKVRQILWKYLEFWDEQNWINQSGEKLNTFENTIVSDLDSLSEEDQVHLLTASGYAYNNPVRDSYNLDENSARFRLFDFIIDPSERVKQAFAMHEQQLTDNSEKEKERIRLDSISTNYFTAFVSAICVSPNGWIATGELMRKDTSEMCPRRIEVKGNNEKDVLNEATERLKNILVNSEAPTDWKNPDTLRQLLWRYIDFHRGPKNGARYSDEESEIVKIDFMSELKLISEKDQIRLFSAMENNCNIEDECNNVDYIVNFYEVHARMRLFELIENPVEKVKQAFEKYVLHLKQIRDRQKKGTNSKES